MHSNQYGTSLSTYTGTASCFTTTYKQNTLEKAAGVADGTGPGAIWDQAIIVCIKFTLPGVLHVWHWPLDRGPVCPDQHCISNSAFPEATGWPQNMQDSTGTSGDAGMLRHAKLVLWVWLICVSSLSCVSRVKLHKHNGHIYVGGYRVQGTHFPRRPCSLLQ